MLPDYSSDSDDADSVSDEIELMSKNIQETINTLKSQNDKINDLASQHGQRGLHLTVCNTDNPMTGKVYLDPMGTTATGWVQHQYQISRLDVEVENPTNNTTPCFDNQNDSTGEIFDIDHNTQKAKALVTRANVTFQANLSIKEEVYEKTDREFRRCVAMARRRRLHQQPNLSYTERTVRSLGFYLLIGLIGLNLWAFKFNLPPFIWFDSDEHFSMLPDHNIFITIVPLFAAALALYYLRQSNCNHALLLAIFTIAALLPKSYADGLLNTDLPPSSYYSHLSGDFLYVNHGQAQINMDYVHFSVAYLPCERLINIKRLESLLSLHKKTCESIPEPTSINDEIRNAENVVGNFTNHGQRTYYKAQKICENAHGLFPTIYNDEDLGVLMSAMKEANITEIFAGIVYDFASHEFYDPATHGMINYHFPTRILKNDGYLIESLQERTDFWSHVVTHVTRDEYYKGIHGLPFFTYQIKEFDGEDTIILREHFAADNREGLIGIVDKFPTFCTIPYIDDEPVDTLGVLYRQNCEETTKTLEKEVESAINFIKATNPDALATSYLNNNFINHSPTHDSRRKRESLVTNSDVGVGHLFLRDPLRQWRNFTQLLHLSTAQQCRRRQETKKLTENLDGVWPWPANNINHTEPPNSTSIAKRSLFATMAHAGSALIAKAAVLPYSPYALTLIRHSRAVPFMAIATLLGFGGTVTSLYYTLSDDYVEAEFYSEYEFEADDTVMKKTMSPTETRLHRKVNMTDVMNISYRVQQQIQIIIAKETAVGKKNEHNIFDNPVISDFVSQEDAEELAEKQSKLYGINLVKDRSYWDVKFYTNSEQFFLTFGIPAEQDPYNLVEVRPLPIYANGTSYSTKLVTKYFATNIDSFYPLTREDFVNCEREKICFTARPKLPSTTQLCGIERWYKHQSNKCRYEERNTMEPTILTILHRTYFAVGPANVTVVEKCNKNLYNDKPQGNTFNINGTGFFDTQMFCTATVNNTYQIQPIAMSLHDFKALKPISTRTVSDEDPASWDWLTNITIHNPIKKLVNAHKSRILKIAFAIAAGFSLIIALYIAIKCNKCCKRRRIRRAINRRARQGMIDVEHFNNNTNTSVSPRQESDYQLVTFADDQQTNQNQQENQNLMLEQNPGKKVRFVQTTTTQENDTQLTRTSLYEATITNKKSTSAFKDLLPIEAMGTMPKDLHLTQSFKTDVPQEMPDFPPPPSIA